MSAMENRDRAQSVTRKFNGVDKTSRRWDCLRKDQDLWYEDANCFVHFHAQGSSQRPASLKIPFAAVQPSNCAYLLDSCLSSRRVSNSSEPSDSGYDSCTVSSPQSRTYDLYVPAPSDLTREQAYTYHVTTRNYFALLTNQALVGEKLGLALVDLWQRTKDWQPNENATALLLSYCDQQGYLSLAENVTHATAILTFAEHAQIQELWTNAFVHCVGMHDRLDLSRDYPELSSTTRALIIRASLEMDLHMSRATRAIGCFLEEELGTDRLGLSKAARNHLDRFRGFLHSFYLEQLGYFPPDSSDPYNRQLWNNMHGDFECLYELLADTTSDGSIHNDTNASGGICCLQNTQAFDVRHGCTPLAHPSPLLPLPATPTKRSTDTQKSLRSLRLGRSMSIPDTTLPPRRALAEASNTITQEMSARPIVAEYRRFERLRVEDKITLQEARKVRWLLIYATLQLLKSVTRTPKGVKDIEAVSYPLCVLTTGTPEWHANENEENPVEQTISRSVSDVELCATPLPLTPASENPGEIEGRISIHPDCEAENATDYFSNSRRSSINALEMTPPPLRINRPTRTASIRTSVSSGVNVLQRSLSLARRNSSLRSVQTAPKHRRMNSYEVVGQGYGSVTEEKEAPQHIVSQHSPVAVEEPAVKVAKDTTDWQEFDFGLQNVGEEPTLDDRHLNSIIGLESLNMSEEEVGRDFESVTDLGRLEEIDEDTSPYRNSWAVSEAAFTTARWPVFDEPMSATSYSSASEPSSLRSSYLADDCDTPVSIYSPSVSPRNSHRGSVEFPKSYSSFRSSQGTRPRHISLVGSQPDLTSASAASLNVGCYRPSGLPGPPTFAPALSKFASSRTVTTLGTASTVTGAGSAASSVYHMDGQQADDREADTVRGRRRTRMWDGVASLAFDDE